MSHFLVTANLLQYFPENSLTVIYAGQSYVLSNVSQAIILHPSIKARNSKHRKRGGKNNNKKVGEQTFFYNE